jgi:hypothetical protein
VLTLSSVVISCCFNKHFKMVHSRLAFSDYFHEQLQMSITHSVLKIGKMVYQLAVTSSECM